MEYTVIKVRGAEELIKKVNEAIQEGWEPLGGMAVEPHRIESFDSIRTYFYQSMIKR